MHAAASNDYASIFYDLDIVFGEERSAVVIAQLSKGDECSSLEVIKHESFLCPG